MATDTLHFCFLPPMSPAHAKIARQKARDENTSNNIAQNYGNQGEYFT
jgi:hypothetical protein